jgi:hypothetical protein
MNEDLHAARREAKRRTARYGMRVSGRSTKTVILAVIVRKAKGATK